jgi:hypothetical protein
MVLVVEHGARPARLVHGCTAPILPGAPSPTHRRISLSVLAHTLTGVLDIFPVLGILGLKCRDTVLIPGDPSCAIRGMNRRMGFVVQLFLALASSHTHDWHGFVLHLEQRNRCRLHASQARATLPRALGRASTLYAPSGVGAMACAGDGGRLRSSCGNAATSSSTIACSDTRAVGRRCSSTTGTCR